MFDIVGKNKWIWFVISGIVIIPGIIGLILWGLNLGIDFKGGTLLEINFPSIENVEQTKINEILVANGIENAQISKSGVQNFLIRLKPIEHEVQQKIMAEISQKIGEVKEVRLETVGPTISRDLARKAFISVILASLGIVIYLAWAFRRVPRPVTSWRFGVCAVAALIHDVLVVTGIFSILGHFFKVEIDSMFVTALLTIIGFSVHDTIVVFDRIRENLKTRYGESFANIANHSVYQTLGRSLNTSLTVIFTLLALFLFGGATIKYFALALLIGIIAGTYSSIFNATPLLVLWQEIIIKKKVK